MVNRIGNKICKTNNLAGNIDICAAVIFTTPVYCTVVVIAACIGGMQEGNIFFGRLFLF
jgi:hypothetical protein